MAPPLRKRVPAKVDLRNYMTTVAWRPQKCQVETRSVLDVYKLMICGIICGLYMGSYMAYIRGLHMAYIRSNGPVVDDSSGQS